ncbi:MAG: PilZ domain-containing protein, partial [Coleofasciculus sp. S288]|nr:PilZ domain-containing protein [Coleofasciculus sp. S288]
IYNIFVMSAAILSGIDQPVRRVSDRFPLCTACKLTVGNRVFWGYTNNLSEGGASITLTTNSFLGKTHPVVLEFLEHDFSIEAEIVRTSIKDSYVNLSVKFSNVTLEQNRNLVTLLYCNLDSWKHRRQPGVLDSALAMLSSILNIKPIMAKYNS